MVARLQEDKANDTLTTHSFVDAAVVPPTSAERCSEQGHRRVIALAKALSKVAAIALFLRVMIDPCMSITQASGFMRLRRILCMKIPRL